MTLFFILRIQRRIISKFFVTEHRSSITSKERKKLELYVMLHVSKGKEEEGRQRVTKNTSYDNNRWLTICFFM